jgi:hypothetical protein
MRGFPYVGRLLVFPMDPGGPLTARPSLPGRRRLAPSTLRCGRGLTTRRATAASGATDRYATLASMPGVAGHFEFILGRSPMSHGGRTPKADIRLACAQISLARIPITCWAVRRRSTTARRAGTRNPRPAHLGEGRSPRDIRYRVATPPGSCRTGCSRPRRSGRARVGEAHRALPAGKLSRS